MIVALGEVDQLPADTRGAGEPRQFTNAAGHLPIVIAVGPWRRFAPGDQARRAHEFCLRNSPAPSSAVQSSARLAGSGTALGVTVSVCSSTSAPLVVTLSATKN